MQFESVYRAHYAAIRRMVRHLGVADRDAHDVAQEVFVVAFRKFSEFEGRSSAKTWLVGIAYRVVANRHRSAAIRREVLGEVVQERSHPSHEPEGQLEQRELQRQFERVLDALPEEQRVVFVLFELEELSGDEIAAALAIPVGTVRSRLRLARELFSRRARALNAPSSTSSYVGER